MTDAELVIAIERKPIEALTIGELDALRERLVHSEPLRAAIRRRISLEATFADAMKSHGIDLDAALAESVPTKPPSSRLATIAAVAVVVVVVSVAVAVLAILNSGDGGDAGGDRRKVSDAVDNERSAAPVRNAAAAPSTEALPAVEAPVQQPAAQETALRPTPAAVIPPEEPWSAAMSRVGPFPPFGEVCFRGFDGDAASPNIERLGKWLTAVENQPFRLFDARTRFGPCAGVEGVARLRSPWTEDSTLRLAIEDFQRLKLHFFAGDSGLSLVYYEHLNYAWAGYATTRSGGTHEPASYVLTATDDRRGQRTETRFGGPMEIRWRNGEIVLSRGDIVLLRGPLAAPPSDLFFVGKAVFNGLAIDRDGEFPPAPKPGQTVRIIDASDNSQWQLDAAGEFTKLEATENGVSLVAEKASEHGFVTLPLDNAGVCEIVLELNEAAPGTGVFLGRADRRPRELLRFERDARTGRTGVVLRWDDDVFEENLPPLEDAPTAIVSERPWLKLIFGAGLMRWATSVDGVHWAEPREPAYDVPGEITCLGLTHVRGEPLRRIALKSVRIRQFDALTEIGDVRFNVLYDGRAQLLPLDRGVAAWLAAAIEQTPDTAEPASWLRLCAHDSLKRGCPGDLGRYLLTALIDDAPEELSAEKLRAALGEAMLLDDFRDYGRLERAWKKLSEIGAAREGPAALAPYSFARQALLSLPINAPHALRFSVEGAIRNELIQLASAGQWTAAQQVARDVKFYEQRDFAPLVDWIGAVAAGHIGGRSALRLKSDWESPLAAPIDNEAYSQWAAIYASLDAGSAEDSAAALTALDPEIAGLSPSRHDERLLVDSRAALSLVLSERDDIRQSLAGDSAALAQLRIRQAIAAGDVAGVELASLQFAGALAAEEARQWLAARALATGDFTETAAGGGEMEESLFPPGGLIARPAARLDGDVGQSPDQEVTRHVRRFNVDWAGRQIAALPHGDALLVSNRFQVAAYDAATGARRWQTAGLPGPMARSQEWSLTRMVPKIVGDKVFARLLYGAGPTLFCLNAADGKTQWTYEPPADELLIADPLMLDGWLVACTLARTSPREHALRLTTIDPATGFLLSQTELARVRESWLGRRFAALAAEGDSLVVALGGATIGCDARGRVRWQRRDDPLPTEEEPSWVRQHFQPPLVREGSVYTLQPGVRTVECLELATGASRWRVCLPDVERIVAVAKERLIVQTAAGFMALDAASGNVNWRRAASELLEAQASDGEALIYSQIDRQPNARPRVRLAWLDLASGEERGATTIAALEDDDPRLGPLVVHRGKLWAFFGKGPVDPYRDLLELTRDAAAPFDAPSTIAPLVAEPWLTHLDRPLSEAFARRLPNWRLIAGEAGTGAGATDGVWGRDRVVGVRAHSTAPLLLGRRVDLSGANRFRLKVVLAREPSRPIVVEVLSNGRSITSRELTAASHPEPWQSLDFDLAGLQATALLLRVKPLDGDWLPIYLQSLEIAL